MTDSFYIGKLLNSRGEHDGADEIWNVPSLEAAVRELSVSLEAFSDSILLVSGPFEVTSWQAFRFNNDLEPSPSDIPENPWTTQP